MHQGPVPRRPPAFCCMSGTQGLAAQGQTPVIGLRPPVQTHEPSDWTHWLPATPAARPSSPGSTCLAGFPPVANSSRRTHVRFYMRASWLSPLVVLGLAVREERPPGPEHFGLGWRRAQPIADHWSKGNATCSARESLPPHFHPSIPGGPFWTLWPACNAISCL